MNKKCLHPLLRTFSILPKAYRYLNGWNCCPAEKNRNLTIRLFISLFFFTLKDLYDVVILQLRVALLFLHLLQEPKLR